MADGDEILKVVVRTETRQNDLIKSLYGSGGNRGDIPTLLDKCDSINGRCRKNEVRSKINRWFLLSMFLGGGTVVGAIGKLLEAW